VTVFCYTVGMRAYRFLVVIIGVVLLAAACGRGSSSPTSVSQRPQVPVSQKPVVLPTPTPTPTAVVRPLDLAGKQVVIFAFDGSKSLDMWQQTLDFADSMERQGKPIHFTYFINAIYFLTYPERNEYQQPSGASGKPSIGYADSTADVVKRIQSINRALASGHEIGSHLVGHFDGSRWTAQDWRQEFSEFNRILDQANSINAIDPLVAKLQIPTNQIIGFRAPELAHNQSLWPILSDFGYAYDASVVGKIGDQPKKVDGVWRFTVPLIPVYGTTRRILSMDYNFYFMQTHTKDILKAGTPEWENGVEQMYWSYINYFDTSYKAGKTPVYIAHHFSRWNDGAYWEALQRFAADECGKVDVACVTYKDYVRYLDAQMP
jgi:hypothetical protein